MQPSEVSPISTFKPRLPGPLPNLNLTIRPLMLAVDLAAIPCPVALHIYSSLYYFLQNVNTEPRLVFTSPFFLGLSRLPNWRMIPHTIHRLF